MYNIIGTMIDGRGTTWGGNPCNANPIWLVGNYKDKKHAYTMCYELNRIAQKQKEKLKELYPMAIPTSLEEKYDEEWCAIGFKVISLEADYDEEHQFTLEKELYNSGDLSRM